MSDFEITTLLAVSHGLYFSLGCLNTHPKQGVLFPHQVTLL